MSCLMNPEKRETAYKYLSGLQLSSNNFTNLTYKLYGRYFLIALTQLCIIQDLMGCLQSGSVFDGYVLISRWVGASLGESSIIHNIKPTECVPVHETIEGIVNQCRGLSSPSSTVEEVLSVISKVLLRDFGLRNCINLNELHFDCFRIDKVLYKKIGFPSTLTIVFHEVGTRLGLTFGLVKFPRRLVLSFEGSDGITKYIDCFDSGKILSRSQCLQFIPNLAIRAENYYFRSATPVQVLVKLTGIFVAIAIYNAGRSPYNRYFFALSLYKLMSYLYPEHRRSCARALHYSLSFHIKCNFIKNFSSISPARWSTYCRRTSESAERLKEWMFEKQSKPRHIKFSIGLVMMHRRKNYTCVICGWDERCLMSEEWQEENGIYNLEFQGNQPFYRVLANNDSYADTRYVPQEDLILTRSVFINHKDVGKYFRLFNGLKFVPNSALRSIYSYLKKK